MQKPRKFFTALSIVVLSAMSLHGCTPVRTCTPIHSSAECRSCHTPNGALGARDFSAIYANPSSHHPVGIKYPVGSNATPGFSSPNGHSADIMFFDKNGNGQPDSNEVQLFDGCGAAVTVECASCHKEHGNVPPPANAPANSYLRFDNADSALCTTCHSY